MKLTVLVDNSTLIDRYFQGEPGLSFLLQLPEKTLLLDTGYSDLFARNASTMGLDLTKVDMVVLSHGHNDHTWGLPTLAKLFSGTGRKPQLIAHEKAFAPKYHHGDAIGVTMPAAALAGAFQVHTQNEPLWVTPELLYLGAIPRTNGFENKAPVTSWRDANGQLVEDFVPDDTALAYRGKEGLVIITGCSHSGICNIVEQAMALTGERRVVDIVGGFHLLGSSPSVLEQTAAYLRKVAPQKMHPCHCTDLAAKLALSGVCPLGEVGVSTVLTY